MSGSLGTLAGMLKHKLGGLVGSTTTNGHDRAGAVVTIDQTPFLLTPSLHTEYPGATVIAESNSTLAFVGETATRYHRLYFSPETFLQVVWDGETITECRYFAEYASVSPASETEWDDWLGDDQGLLGWKQFQIDDTGAIFDRLWAPGSERIAPVSFIEQTSRKIEFTHDAMLYARTIEGTQEYVLVSLIGDARDRSRWIQVATGLDLNPASIGMS